MADTMLISDLVAPDIDTIATNETVRAAQRRMESQTLRSLIAVDGDRPVGVLKWRDIRTADGDTPVAEFVTRDFPVLTSDMHVNDARSRVGDVDFDNIPVIDENGQLVGQVPRGALVHHEATVSESGNAAGGATVTTADAGIAGDIRADMEVIDAEGDKLGKVSEVTSDPTTARLAYLVIEHGLLRKKHKRVPIDTVNRFDGDSVVLSITKMEWDFLADVEDQEA